MAIAAMPEVAEIPGSGSGTVCSQRTLSREAAVQGTGYVTGAEVHVRLLPAEADHGYRFVRTDLPGSPTIPAAVEFALDRRRRTSLGDGPAVVEMVEHVLSALRGTGVDNCIIEVDAPELPGLDGSAQAYVDAIDAAGTVELSALRRPYIVDEPLCAFENDTLIALYPGPMDRLEVTFNLDYPHPGIGKQSRLQQIDEETYRTEIAAARTFVLEEEVAALRQQGLGSRTSTRDLLVFGADGRPIHNELRFPDECVRHKILDVVGDLALFGRPIFGHVFANKSGHRLTVDLVRRLVRKLDRWNPEQLAAKTPAMDAIAISKLLPHRFPFILVDRVLDVEPRRRAVGIKNVTVNEAFFTGHWPGRPVMPGVLILEAMAQLAGLMLTGWKFDDCFVMISAMEDVKFRRPVVPGDQLWLESEVVRLKTKSAMLKTTAKVDGKLAAQATLSFVQSPQHDDPMNEKTG